MLLPDRARNSRVLKLYNSEVDVIKLGHPMMPVAL